MATSLYNGNAGNDTGEYMMGGTITVKGNTDINVGIHAGRGIGPKDVGGKIVVYGNCPGRVGGQLIRGNIYVLGKIEAMMPGFTLKEKQEIDLEGDGKKIAFNVYHGRPRRGRKGLPVRESIKNYKPMRTSPYGDVHTLFYRTE